MHRVTISPLLFRFGYLLLLLFVWLLWLGLPTLCWIKVVRVNILVLIQLLVGRLLAFLHWVLYWLCVKSFFFFLITWHVSITRKKSVLKIKYSNKKQTFCSWMKSAHLWNFVPYNFRVPNKVRIIWFYGTKVQKWNAHYVCDTNISNTGTANREYTILHILAFFLLALHDLMLYLHNLNDSFEWHVVA